MYRIFNVLIWFSKAIENILQFIMLCLLFYILFFVIYIIFALANAPFINYMQPLVQLLLSIAEQYNVMGSNVGGYIISLVILFSILGVLFLLKNIFEFITLKLNRFRISCIQFEEKQLNKSLKREIKSLNKNLKYALVYFELLPQKIQGVEVSLEEQYQLLIKFFSSKFFRMPQKYKNGYLFKDVDFETLDTFFEAFLKALNSAAPVKYLFAVQVVDENGYEVAYSELDSLVKTGLYGHILLTPATKLRYEHNKTIQYEMTVVGNYVNDGEYRNVYEVRDKFF